MQERLAALARRPKSSAPIGFLRLRSFLPLTCFCRLAEQVARLYRSALRCIAMVATGTKVSGSFSASLMLLRCGPYGGGRRPL